MELTLVWTIARRELREALHNKWLWFFAVGLAGLGLHRNAEGPARQVKT